MMMSGKILNNDLQNDPELQQWSAFHLRHVVIVGTINDYICSYEKS